MMPRRGACGEAGVRQALWPSGAAWLLWIIVPVAAAYGAGPVSGISAEVCLASEERLLPGFAVDLVIRIRRASSWRRGPARGTPASDTRVPWYPPYPSCEGEKPDLIFAIDGTPCYAYGNPVRVRGAQWVGVSLLRSGESLLRVGQHSVSVTHRPSGMQATTTFTIHPLPAPEAAALEHFDSLRGLGGCIWDPRTEPDERSLPMASLREFVEKHPRSRYRALVEFVMARVDYEAASRAHGLALLALCNRSALDQPPTQAERQRVRDARKLAQKAAGWFLRLHDEAASSSLKQRCLYEAAKCHTVTRDAEAYDAVLRRLAAEYRSFPYGLRAAEIVGEVPGVDEHPPSGLGAAPGAAAAGAPRGSPGAQGRPYGWRVVAAGIALLAFLALTVGRLMFSGSRRRKTKGSDRVNS